MPNLLDRKTRTRIDQLCAEGNALCDDEGYPAAARKFDAALALFPEPAVQWGEPAMYAYAALGDIHFLSRNFSEARQPLMNALLCGGHEIGRASCRERV